MSPQSMFVCRSQPTHEVYHLKFFNSNLLSNSFLFLFPPPLPTHPKDIIEILQLQYKPFLLLAAQLQIVHEQVQVYLVV